MIDLDRNRLLSVRQGTPSRCRPRWSPMAGTSPEQRDHSGADTSCIQPEPPLVAPSRQRRTTDGAGSKGGCPRAMQCNETTPLLILVDGSTYINAALLTSQERPRAVGCCPVRPQRNASAPAWWPE